jgi:aryl-alcohol dehydrogenase-like predicted oxidoreductase
VLRQPGVSCAIAGTGNPERVKGNAAAAELHLSDSALEAVEGLVPLGPAFG